jgi:hypothetical protein
MGWCRGGGGGGEAAQWRGGEATNMNEGGDAGERRGGDVHGGGAVGQRHGTGK